MHGGNSGSLTQIDLNRVTKIKLTSGEFQYGGNHLLAMTFTYDDGSSQVVGSTNYALSTHDETFDLPIGTSFRQVKIWSGGWLVDGMQFVLN